MRAIILFACCFVLSVSLSAQHVISGIVKTGDIPAIGADVSIYKMGSDIFLGSVTGRAGEFVIENVSAGRYRIIVNYLGFKKFRKRIEIDANYNLGEITLEEDIIEIDGVEITGSMIQAIQKGDTTVFNAGAFKTLPDADAKELIAKIPGIEIENGTVKANGENVQRVTVDGQEFFGTDPNVALNALPAEIIQKIEIIDEKSESAQFTGFDDGNTTKTINIVTKPEARNGEFGKVYGGYGEEDRYQSGGNINFFNGKQRTSLIGLSNNVNQQNFSTEDLLGVTGGRSGRRGRGRQGRGSNDFLISQQDGIATTNSIGINFSDKWGSKTDFSGSYFFNNSDTKTDQFIEQEFLSDRAEGDIYTEENQTVNDNTNHRFQGRLNINLDDRNSIRIRPRISWQGNNTDELSDTEYLRRDQNPESVNNMYMASNSGFNINNSIRYRHKFLKEGRTISLSLENSLRPSDGSSLLSSSFDQSSSEVEDQISESESKTTGYGLELDYTESINKNSQLTFEYEFEKDNGEDQEFTYDGLDNNISFQIDELSNDQNTSELTHTFGSGYRWRKDKTMLLFRARVENTNISSEQILPSSFMTDKSYTNFLPFVMLRTEFSKSSNLRLFYRPRTDNPSSSQLSETVDNTNPLQLTKGNVDIEQGYQHSLFARFSSTNKTNGTVFYLFAGGDFSSNYIGQRTYLGGRDVPLYATLGLDERAQLTLPENQSGYLSLRSYVTIGLPITAIKSKLNFNLSGNYSNTPSIIDDIGNETKNSSLGLGVSLTSNISDRIDFTVSSKTSLGNTTNSLQPEFDAQYVNQSSSLKLNVIFPYGIIWRNQINHQIYSGFGDGFDDSFLLGIMSLGKKFLKNERAEISVSVFDLFNQNQAISRNITSTYIENISNNVLQRYFMINFKYDIRHFGNIPRSSGSDRGQNRERGKRGDRNF